MPEKVLKCIEKDIGGNGIDEDTVRKMAEEDVSADFQSGFFSLEEKFNSIISPRGDYPFITISFGIGRDRFAQMASIAALRVRKNGHGKDGYKRPILFRFMSVHITFSQRRKRIQIRWHLCKEGFTMKGFWNTVQLVFAGVGGWLGWFLGGCDGLLYALVAVDYVTGVLRAVADRKLFSEVGFKGIAKKALIFLLVRMANVLDVQVIGSGSVLCSAVA